jgi:uncharacterized protein (TIGR02266 family)
VKTGGGSRKSVLRPKRVDINVEFDSIDRFINEYVSNISRSGAFIRTRDPWPVGTRLRLRFTIMAEDPEILEGVGEVVRVSDRPRGMGVAFVELTEHSHQLIAKLLTRPALRGARRGASSSSSSD